jgi:DNA-binding NtrC family response regulator
MFDVTAPVLAAQQGARLLQGTIHYRPDDSYRRLYTQLFGSNQGGTPEAELPSITAWSWVARRRCPVSIDVDSQLLRVFEGGPPRLIHDQSGMTLLKSGATLQRLQDREVNYVHVLPIRSPGNSTDGMVSIEMRCQSEMGALVAATCGETLQLLVDLAAPHLASLPSAPSVAPSAPDEFLPVIGAETANMVELLRVFSRLEETILITGPTGVGKSRLARYCHAQSFRRDKPFVTLDLLACPHNLEMAQLVGWRKGAFTGADKDSPGAVQRAAGGSLFLDEIDKLSLESQAGLLRLLEDRVYRPVGDSGEDRKAEVRFIVGTNANLRAALEAGRFREDLYYRIAVLRVAVPPLAKRHDEIPAWSSYLLRRCHAASQGSQKRSEARLDTETTELLQSQIWPGNLRELDNVVRRAYAFSLVDQSQGVGPVVVSKAHVEQALRQDAGEQGPASEGPSLPRQMRAAAQVYAQEVKRRLETNAPLSLEWADAFRGLVIEAAIRRFGSKEAALEALGLANVVRDRNHHRIVKRELDLVARFLAWFEGHPGEDTMRPT